MNDYYSKINFYNKNSGKIAGFDLDSTLIKTQSGRVRPKDKFDWQFYVSNLKEVLLNLQKEDYNIVIFTNQSGLSKSEEKRKDFLFKINSILFELGHQLKISYFIANTYNRYRKPMIGFLDLLKEEYGKINFKKSFYCGDAAGRPANWKYSYDGNEFLNKKKDFSASDLYFAHNMNFRFYTPEEFFFNKNFTSDTVLLPDRTFLDYYHKKTNNEFNLKLKNTEKYLIMMIGLPASGKSYLSKIIKNIHKNFNFQIINQDGLVTKSKFNKLLKECIDKEDNIIIDNTNLKKKDRDSYFDLIKEKNKDYNVIGIQLTTDLGIINQLNYFRCYFTNNFIKKVVYNTLKKRMEINNLQNEKFDKLIKYNYQPKFKNKLEEKIFLMYY